MPAGYSGTPLPQKLGLKEGYHVRLVHPPKHYLSLLGDIGAKIRVEVAEADATKAPAGQNRGAPALTPGTFDFIHLFTNSFAEMERLFPTCKHLMKKDGTLWVSWYKKSSGKATELNENIVRDAGLAAGLVDVKVCAVDEDWSGLKFVLRLKDRRRAGPACGSSIFHGFTGDI